MDAYLIEDVRLFDGIKVHENPVTVYVCNGVIRSVAAKAPSDVPGDTVIVQGTGCTLLPGFIDAHVHVFRGVEEAKASISAGVTTVFDMHNEPKNAIFMKDLSRTSIELPEIYSAFHAATIDGGWPRAIVRHTNSDTQVLAALESYPKLHAFESAVAYVAKNKSMGADFIKLMQESAECLTFPELPAPTKVLQEAVIGAAKDHNLLTFAHATNLRETLLVLDAGVDALAHQSFDQKYTDQLIASYKRSNAFVIPTLTAINSMMGLQTAKGWAQSPLSGNLLSPKSRHSLCDCLKISRDGCSIDFAYDCIKALKANGVDIVCGTDSGPSIHGTALGPAMHLELSLYVKHCGFTPIEALVSATSRSAKRLRLEDRGRIEVGWRADLLLVRGDPTQNIGDTVNVGKVWKAGELCGVVSSSVG